ncbi:MAG: CpsD/CapB family tyrosine-protein kinase [Acidimicrobiia bacterium]|nr:CpsD/CapB family tyrosine-protein kinase [Acidimicrobiia bacterium]MBV9411088.1 CpsD/CapB family tyrosine-protein kinase [Acidimicrobiia bacterium]
MPPRFSPLRRSVTDANIDESFRILRSNVEVALVNLEPPIAIVTSAYPGEGKTWTVVGLARALASAGRRVVLVDLDLRKPGVHNTLVIPNEVGVSDVLLGRRSLNDCLQYVEFDGAAGPGRGLYVLTTGKGVSEPAELLGTNRTVRLLEGLAEQADLVLIDTPPVLPVADTLIIGRMVAGAVLVVEARKTSIPAVQRATEQLTRNQTRILGVVVNKSTERGDGYGYGYGYEAGYGYESAAVVQPPAAERE